MLKTSDSEVDISVGGLVCSEAISLLLHQFLVGQEPAKVTVVDNRSFLHSCIL